MGGTPSIQIQIQTDTLLTQGRGGGGSAAATVSYTDRHFITVCKETKRERDYSLHSGTLPATKTESSP